jgi:hypothetical protein
MKRIVFSDHAREQLAERTLVESGAVETVMDPDDVVVSGDRLVAQKVIYERSRAYLLRVIYEEQAETLHIISVYKTSKIAKYRSAP